MKDKLIKARGRKCESCRKTKWLGKPIPLEIHHVNPPSEKEEDLQLLCPNCHAMTENYRGRGIRTAKNVSDDDIRQAITQVDNVRQLLINLNLAAKGGNYDVIRKRIIALGFKDKFIKPNPSETICLECGFKFVEGHDKLKFCSRSCSGKYHVRENLNTKERKTKIKWPEYSIVFEMTKQFGFLETGRKLGVSDNAVRKRLNTRRDDAIRQTSIT